MRLSLATVAHSALAAACVLSAAALPPGASAQTGARQAGAQGRPPAQDARPPAPRPGEGAQTPRTNQADANADLSITARVTADSLRFEKVPNTRVEFTGKPARDTAWEAERENLPQQVQPGVTYRNIGITLRIVSVFADIDRIVAEALGEVPPSDDARPPAPPPERPPVFSEPPSCPSSSPPRQRARARRRARAT